MNNWDLYMLAHIPANKDVLSNWLTPEQFETELTAKNIMLIRDKIGLPQRYQPGTMRMGASASRTIETDLLPFLRVTEETLVSNETSLTDWYYINDFYTVDSISSEIISQQELGQRKNHPIRKATEKYPWAIITSNGLKIYPATVTACTVSYYRQPSKPYFATTVNEDGELVYDEANSNELEWSDQCKLEILNMILQDLGVNIEKQDLEQLAQKLVESGK
jgi:hypothetical protein